MRSVERVERDRWIGAGFSSTRVNYSGLPSGSVVECIPELADAEVLVSDMYVVVFVNRDGRVASDDIRTVIHGFGVPLDSVKMGVLKIAVRRIEVADVGMILRIGCYRCACADRSLAVDGFNEPVVSVVMGVFQIPFGIRKKIRDMRKVVR